MLDYENMQVRQGIYAYHNTPKALLRGVPMETCEWPKGTANQESYTGAGGHEMNLQVTATLERDSMRHTAGPWRACHEGNCQCRQVWSIPADVPVFTARANKLSHIGLAHHKWGDGPELIYGEIPKEETEANAKLIAAAPELLEAVRSAIGDAELNGGKLLSSTKRALDEVLAKAEGR